MALDKILIGGEWRNAETGETLAVFAPSDGREFARIARGDEGATSMPRSAPRAPRSRVTGGACQRWSAVGCCASWARWSSTNAEELAALEARDTGKPMKQARADMVAAARYFEFFGGAADKIHGETIPFLVRLPGDDPARAARRDRAHHPVELSRPRCSGARWRPRSRPAMPR